MNTELTDRLRELLTPSLRQCGVELVDLTWGTGPTGFLRVTIDRLGDPDHPGGVTLDDCERVSMAVSSVLDAHDPITGRYQLEVTSPGAERPIHSSPGMEEWHAAIGRRVNVRYRDGDAEGVLEGRLLAVGPEAMEVERRLNKRFVATTIPAEAVIAGRIVVDI